MNTLDRFKASIEQVIRALLPPLDYVYALYPGKVLKQNLDGTLQVRLDAPSQPDMTDVPIYYGVPGIKATVAAGARVLIGFAGGKPTAPIAHLWESASVTKLEVNATEIVFNGGTQKVSRVGDATAGHGHTATFILEAGPDPGPSPGSLLVVGSITIVPNNDTMAEGANGVKA